MNAFKKSLFIALTLFLTIESSTGQTKKLKPKLRRPQKANVATILTADDQAKVEKAVAEVNAQATTAQEKVEIKKALQTEIIKETQEIKQELAKAQNEHSQYINYAQALDIIKSKKELSKVRGSSWTTSAIIKPFTQTYRLFLRWWNQKEYVTMLEKERKSLEHELNVQAHNNLMLLYVALDLKIKQAAAYDVEHMFKKDNFYNIVTHNVFEGGAILAKDIEISKELKALFADLNILIMENFNKISSNKYVVQSIWSMTQVIKEAQELIKKNPNKQNIPYNVLVVEKLCTKAAEINKQVLHDNKKTYTQYAKDWILQPKNVTKAGLVLGAIGGLYIFGPAVPAWLKEYTNKSVTSLVESVKSGTTTMINSVKNLWNKVRGNKELPDSRESRDNQAMTEADVDTFWLKKGHAQAAIAAKEQENTEIFEAYHQPITQQEEEEHPAEQMDREYIANLDPDIREHVEFVRSSLPDKSQVSYEDLDEIGEANRWIDEEQTRRNVERKANATAIQREKELAVGKAEAFNADQLDQQRSQEQHNKGWEEFARQKETARMKEDEAIEAARLAHVRVRQKVGTVRVPISELTSIMVPAEMHQLEKNYLLKDDYAITHTRNDVLKKLQEQHPTEKTNKLRLQAHKIVDSYIDENIDKPINQPYIEKFKSIFNELKEKGEDKDDTLLNRKTAKILDHQGTILKDKIDEQLEIMVKKSPEEIIQEYGNREAMENAQLARERASQEAQGREFLQEQRKQELQLQQEVESKERLERELQERNAAADRAKALQAEELEALSNQETEERRTGISANPTSGQIPADNEEQNMPQFEIDNTLNSESENKRLARFNAERTKALEEFAYLKERIEAVDRNIKITDEKLRTATGDSQKTWEAIQNDNQHSKQYWEERLEESKQQRNIELNAVQKGLQRARDRERAGQKKLTAEQVQAEIAQQQQDRVGLNPTSGKMTDRETFMVPKENINKFSEWIESQQEHINKQRAIDRWLAENREKARIQEQNTSQLLQARYYEADQAKANQAESIENAQKN